MIRVDVKDYCSECMDFEPDVEKPQKIYCGGFESTITDTVIHCKNRRRCDNIRRYFERKDTSHEQSGTEENK